MRRCELLFVCSFLPALVGWAQTPLLGPEFRVNTYTTGDQSRPSVAVGPSGNFVVVWDSYEQDGSGLGIFAQHYDGEGAPLGPEFRVNNTTTGNQARPAVAMDDLGRFVVVWQGPTYGSNSGIFGRRFDADGVPLGEEFQVNSYTSGSQSVPDVDGDDEGGFVVVWQSKPGAYSEVLVRRFDATGLPMGGEFGVYSRWSEGDELSPAVATGGDGEFVVAWQSEWQSQYPPYGWNPQVSVQHFPSGCYDDVGTWPNFPRLDVEMAPSGDYVVAYSDGSRDIRVRRYQSCSLLGESFVNSHAENFGGSPSLAGDASGSFTVTWDGPLGGDILARRFDAQGESLADEFVVNSFTTGEQTASVIAMNGDGKSILAWQSDDQDVSGYGIYAQRWPGPPSPTALDVDRRPSGASNLNGLLEANETVRIDLVWWNGLVSELDLTGTATNLTGPPGADYEITDATADYGTILPGETSGCAETTGDCYEISIVGTRTARHWDAVFEETPSAGEAATWTLHVGESFLDVPTTHMFYANVETVFHNGVTAGCDDGSYCPSSPVRRDQMAVFLLKGRYGGAYAPPSCTGLFLDVPCPGPFADWIEQLFSEGIAVGCGGGNYCPSNPVTRAQMAAFLLKAKHGPGFTPHLCMGLFLDVPCSDIFAVWIEELAYEAITAGCGGWYYCPNDSVTRGQMAVFLVKAFGLRLYGP